MNINFKKCFKKSELLAEIESQLIGPHLNDFFLGLPIQIFFTGRSSISGRQLTANTILLIIKLRKLNSFFSLLFLKGMGGGGIIDMPGSLKIFFKENWHADVKRFGDPDLVFCISRINYGMDA